MLLNNPANISNPFYLMVPDMLQLPMVLLATAATVIASQAVISGAFSLTSQAIQLGFVPRMRIRYTSAAEIGQIYLPVINWILLVLVVIVVVAFKKSENLAAAYGIAVTTTMVITTFLAAVVMRNVWKWHPVLVTLIGLSFLLVDLAFFSANLLKIAEGGWFPLLMGGTAFFLLMTWHSGRKLLRARSLEDGIPLEPFIAGLLAHPPHRVEGTAVFLTGNTDSVPVSLLHNLKHNRVLHERVVFLTFVTRDIPYVDDNQRVSSKDLGGGVFILKSEYGFKETPDVQRVLDLADHKLGMHFELMETSFFIARESVIPSKLPGMPMWRESLFAWMHQNGAKRRTSSRSRPTGWWSWAPRSRSERAGPGARFRRTRQPPDAPPGDPGVLLSARFAPPACHAPPAARPSGRLSREVAHCGPRPGTPASCVHTAPRHTMQPSACH